MSEFSAIQSALSGLLAHRRAIDVIGQNITNVNTEGYTRQRVDLAAVGSSVGSARWSTYQAFNGGVTIEGINRIRDQFLDVRQRREAAADAAASQQATILSSIEGLMPEPSTTGLSAQLAAFWGAWDDAAANPASIPARSAVLSQAATLAQTFTSLSTALTDYRSGLLTSLQTAVAQINSDAGEVAQLNGAIQKAVAAGGDANDLRDRRDLLVDRITSATGASVIQRSDGTVSLSIGGNQLVSGDRVNNLSAVMVGPLPSPLNTVPMQNVSLQWADGSAVTSTGGQLSATLTGLNNTVPRWLSELDGVAGALVSQVNALHTTGHGLNTVTDINLNFFDPAATTAATISLSSDVSGQPSRLALAAGGTGTLDASLANRIAALGDSTTGPDALQRSLSGRLGIEVSTARNRADVQSKVAQQATQARTSYQGVNLDEEMTSLVMSQKAYEASARVLTAVDEMLDTLINRTGLAGR